MHEDHGLSGLRRIKSLDDQIAWFDMIENNWSAMYSLMISDAWASVFQGLLIMMAGCILLAYAFADAFEHLSITGGIVAVRKSPLFQWGLVPFAYAGCMFFKSLFIVMSASSKPHTIIDRKNHMIAEREQLRQRFVDNLTPKPESPTKPLS